MEKLVNKLGGGKKTMIIIAVILLVLGLIFIVWPGTSLVYICRIIGICLIIYSAVQLTRFLMKKEARTAAENMLIALHFVVLAFGIVIEVRPELLMAIVPMILGVIFIINGAFDIVQSATIKSGGARKWWVALLLGIVVVVLGIFMMTRPLSAMQLIMRIVGVMLIYTAVSNICIASMMKKYGPIDTKGEFIEEE